MRPLSMLPQDRGVAHILRWLPLRVLVQGPSPHTSPISSPTPTPTSPHHLCGWRWQGRRGCAILRDRLEARQTWWSSSTRVSRLTCCKCMSQVFQGFHMHVASVSCACCKVDQDIAYVVMAIHIYCKRLFQMFHLFFRRMLQMCLFGYCNVSHICCKCFIWMLHILCNGFSSVSSVSRCMLQMFHLDILKVNRVLHRPARLLLPHLGVSSFSRCRLGIRCPLPFFSMLENVSAVSDVCFMCFI
jgi:hypothetical protein